MDAMHNSGKLEGQRVILNIREEELRSELGRLKIEFDDVAEENNVVWESMLKRIKEK
jgi:hypothetical protein